MEIRPYQDRDEAGVVALWSAVFPNDPPWNEPRAVIARLRRVPTTLFLVGTVDDRLVAAVIAGWDGHRGWIYHLAVTPELRRRGLGRRIMAEAERRLRTLGCQKINLQVRTENAVAVTFYERLGYAVEDRVSLGKRLA